MNPTPGRGLRIGITISLRGPAQSLWENGIGQNCLMLAGLLSDSPIVERAVLIDALENGPGERMMVEETGLGVIRIAEAAELDVVIEMGAQLPDLWAQEFRARGGRYVSMRVGNDYAIDIERAIFDKSPASLCTGKTFDAVWTIPGHEKVCADYFALTTRSPVRILPHIWSPVFFQKKIGELEEGLTYGYKPGGKRWRACTFEPNINMVKTSMVPMMVCEEAYRREPRFLDFFRVCNTFQIKDNPLLVKFANSLDIVTHGLTTFEGRFGIYDFMARQGDVIISHQWGCPQNYLYYEALYGKYPLVHNSELMTDCGYYYPGFDTREGGRVLVEAFLHHDANLESYGRRCDEALRRVDPESPVNIASYTEELLRLYGIDPGGELILPNRPPALSSVDSASRSPSRDLPAGISRAFVINLDRRPDRLEQFLRHHPDLADIVERRSAVDGKTLRLTPALARLFAPNGFGWKKAVMGCALSHLALWVSLSEESSDTATWLILEDDVRLSPGWRSLCREALVRGSLPDDLDIVYLGGILPPNRQAFGQNVEIIRAPLARIRNNSVFGQDPPNPYFHFCTYAYLLTRRGALKLLERIRRHDGIWTPVDHVMCNHESDGLRVGFLHPLPAGCFQDDDPAYVAGDFNSPAGSEGFDSDLRTDTECFGAVEVAAMARRKEPLDPAAVIRELTGPSAS